MQKSYSRRTKDEILNFEVKNDCCAAAQLAGMLLFGGSVSENKIRLISENCALTDKFCALFERVFLYKIETRQEKNFYTAELCNKDIIDRVLKTFALTDPNGGRLIRRRISPDLVKKKCCKRAFVRGAFLGGATIVDPNRNYNLEFVTHFRGLARDFSELLGELSFKTGMGERAGNCVIYTKNSETICDILAAIGAYGAQMEMLNVKIEKELRNGMNRSVNGETANYDKAVSAAVKQLKAIEKIENGMGIKNLPDDLRDLAYMRIRHKDAPLSELGALLSPPLTKSGVSHRMKRLMDIADKN